MGAENSKLKSSKTFTNIQQDKANDVLKHFKNELVNVWLERSSLERTFGNARKLASDIFQKLNKGGRLKTEEFLRFIDTCLGSHDDLSASLILIYGTPQTAIAKICEEFARANKFSDIEIAELIEYFEFSFGQRFSDAQFTKYFMEFPLFVKMCQSVFYDLLSLKTTSDLPMTSGNVNVLSKSAILVINSGLPMNQRKEWALLFSSVSHGSSFARIIKNVNDAGPCIVVIQSNSKKIFGFYASDGIAAGPTYRGNHTCFLFETKPKLRIFYATGRTENYAYLNYQQQSMPNGMGIGGSSDVWPVFIHEEYGAGISQANSSAFDKCHLAGETTFTIKKLEVWRVGEKPEPLIDENTGEAAKSIIDKDPEARAVLEMAGRGLKSDAYRDPAPLLNNVDET